LTLGIQVFRFPAVPVDAGDAVIAL